MIVKVQMPLNAGATQALIYDRDRHEPFCRQVPSEQVAKRMAGRDKAFFYARLSFFGSIVLGDEAPWQEW